MRSKLCRGVDHRGPRWILVTNFGVSERTTAGGVKKLHSMCQSCRRQESNQKRRSSRPHPLPEKVPLPPFRSWLNEKVMGNGITGVASAVGVSPRRITTLLAGYEWKDGKKYEIRNVTLLVVEEFMHPFGQSAWEIYPDAG